MCGDRALGPGYTVARPDDALGPLSDNAAASAFPAPTKAPRFLPRTLAIAGSIYYIACSTGETPEAPWGRQRPTGEGVRRDPMPRLMRLANTQSICNEVHRFPIARLGIGLVF